MSTVLPEVNFSELLQHPKETVAKLEAGQRHALRVHRRDAEDLVLTTAARASQDSELFDVATRIFIVLMGDPVTRSMHLLDTLPRIFPWVRFLPEGERSAFTQEFVEVVQACKELDTPAPVLQIISEWRHTAEVHADPDLLARVKKGVVGDFGVVPEPSR
jgi:hypothetical protein